MIVIVCDGLGIGAAPDAAEFDSVGADTLRHACAAGTAPLPNLAVLGLGAFGGVPLVDPSAHRYGTVARLLPRAPAVDSLAGHRELFGAVADAPPPTFPDGFPPELIARIKRCIQRSVLGNKAADGAEIIDRLGESHLATGSPIVYTSRGSVMQLVAHESVADMPTLTAWGRRIRAEALCGKYAVSRLIVRQFVGTAGAFRRVAREDLPLSLDPIVTLERLREHGVAVWGSGKVVDLFGIEAFTAAQRADTNREVLDGLDAVLRRQPGPAVLIGTLDDFDAQYGHRRNPAGFHRCLAEFDAALPRLLGRLSADDLLIITADHGNDPAAPGYNHTREYLPALLYGPAWSDARVLPVPWPAASVACTVLARYGLATLSGNDLLADGRAGSGGLG